MLHHHPVHLPSNQQLRDSTRLGQPVSMPMHHQRLMNLPPPQANPGCFEPKPLFCQYRFRKLSRPKESMKCTGLVRCPGVLMTMPPPASLAAAPHVPAVVPKLPQTGMSGCGENDSPRPAPQTQPQPPPMVQNGGGNQASSAAAAAAANAAAAAAASNHLANTKEKTPMCLVNELARFNKIQHQYRLTNEQGPAHKKVFTVTLKLGDEEYASDGASIKKAQHSAANEALQHTQYKHPPPKTARNVRLGKSNVTPTVELNALAMKRGEPAIYTFLETTPPIAPPAQPPPTSAPGPPYLQQPPQPSHGFNYRPGQQMYHHQRFHYKTGPGSAPSNSYQPTMFHVCLRVGSREFIGEGPTAQAAKHDAAGKAVSQLKQLPLPDEQPNHRQIDENEIIDTPTDPNTELKSPISLVHEIALKRSYNVTFDVVSEKGPPHMRTFVTKCAVGDKIATGEGNGKKISKKRAAEKMLEELRNLPPPSPTLVASRIKRKSNPGKKKSRNLIKVYHQEQKTETDYGNITGNPGPVNNGGGGGNNGTEDVNPISRLIQIQQAKKEKEPIYTLVEERGVPRRREFVMEVKVGPHASTGCGPNKKLAKRAAAEALLTHLGYSRPTSTPTCPPAPGKSAIKVPSDHSSSINVVEKARKVMFLDETTDKGSGGGGTGGGSDINSTVSAAVASVTPSAGGPSGRQLVPGLLLMADTAQVSGYAATPSKSSGVNLQTTATIAKELLKAGNSPTAEALAKGSPVSGHATGIPVVSSLAALGLASPAAAAAAAAAAAPVSAVPITSPIIKPKEQLLYLAQLLGFQVQFSDFPKGNHSEYLSLVSLSTDPPHVCHGAGSTTEASHDQAALTALRALAEIGLDAVAPPGGPGGSVPQTNGQQETGVDPTGYTQ